jgi:hypothetical protein
MMRLTTGFTVPQDVLDDIVSPDYAGRLDDCILDIHDRFKDMHRKFARNQ